MKELVKQAVAMVAAGEELVRKICQRPKEGPY